MTDSIRHSRHSRHPLSSPQREIWFDQMLHPDAPLYNIGGDHADEPIDQFPLLTVEDERRLRRWNRTEAHFPKNETIVDLFREQVEKTPENIAVVCGDRRLTYRDLNAGAESMTTFSSWGGTPSWGGA